MPEFFQVLSSLHPLSETIKREIEKEVTPVRLPRYHFLVEAPKVPDMIYFLENGFAMTYSFEDDRKHAETFWTPGEFVMSPKSFFEQLPANEFIQLTEDSSLVGIGYSGVQRLLNDFPEAQVMYRLVMNQYYERCRAQLKEMARLNASQRFEKLLHRYPRLEQMVSQELIASYLGITPQSLSRIKREGRF